MERKLILIDISNLVYQTYYGLGYYRESDSIDNMVQDTMVAIQNRIDKLEEEGEVYLIFDAPDGKDKRLKMFPEYKAGREEKPEAVKRILNILEKSAYRKTRKKGLEADDVIAKISNYYKDKEILIVSSDRDLEALLRDGVSILQKGKTITEKDVREELGTDKNLKDFIQVRKALMGDSSDNIKGVSKIGKVKSLKMLNDVEGEDLYNGILNMLNEEQQEEFKLAYELIKFQE